MIEMISDACRDMIISTLWRFYWRRCNRNFNHYSLY